MMNINLIEELLIKSKLVDYFDDNGNMIEHIYDSQTKFENLAKFAEAYHQAKCAESEPVAEVIDIAAEGCQFMPHVRFKDDIKLSLGQYFYTAPQLTQRTYHDRFW